MFTPKTKNPVNYYLQGFQFVFCDPAGTRTQGPNIKSVVLYQLSYEISPLFVLGVQKYGARAFIPKLFRPFIHSFYNGCE